MTVLTETKPILPKSISDKGIHCKDLISSSALTETGTSKGHS